MDPITTAFVTALAIPMAKDVIKDGYDALKAALKKKFGDQSDVVNAVEQLEKKPDSEGRKATLQEEVENAKVNDDPEIVKLAQDFLNQLKEQPGGQQIINQNISNVKYAATSGSGNANISGITEHGTSKDN
jgi:beta-phosphoglucomutase-like phosphatase (HAD superfamily)